MASVDYFLKIDGIEGESADSSHKGEIDVQSWSWGATQSGTMSFGGGGGAGKVNMQDFHFVMNFNKASAKLMLACAQGTHIASCIMTARKAGEGQQDYLKITFSDVLISSYQASGSSLVPTDSISFNFSKVEIEYKEQKPDGSLAGAVKTGYNVKENKKV